MLSTIKAKIIALVIALALILIAIFSRGLYSRFFNPVQPASVEVDENPKVVSTNPSPLDEATVLPTQELQITFNQAIQNEGEIKWKIDPEVETKLKLSDDKKTIKVTFPNTLGLGQGYTLFIKQDTKFDNKKSLPGDQIFHFKTIQYNGV